MICERPRQRGVLRVSTYLDPARRTNQQLPQRGTHRTYVGRLERGQSGVTVDSLVAILAPLGRQTFSHRVGTVFAAASLSAST